MNKQSAYQDDPISEIALGLLLCGWIVMVVVAHIMYKYIKMLCAVV